MLSFLVPLYNEFHMLLQQVLHNYFYLLFRFAKPCVSALQQKQQDNRNIAAAPQKSGNQSRIRRVRRNEAPFRQKHPKRRQHAPKIAEHVKPYRQPGFHRSMHGQNRKEHQKRAPKRESPKRLIVPEAAHMVIRRCKQVAILSAERNELQDVHRAPQHGHHIGKQEQAFLIGTHSVFLLSVRGWFPVKRVRLRALQTPRPWS